MVVLKSSRELELMKEACQISAEALMVAGEAVKPGISTKEIDKIAYDLIIKRGAKPNFLHYGGYPATACISINDEVIHGIPKKTASSKRVTLSASTWVRPKTVITAIMLPHLQSGLARPRQSG